MLGHYFWAHQHRMDPERVGDAQLVARAILAALELANLVVVVQSFLVPAGQNMSKARGRPHTLSRAIQRMI
eukprot:SAG31_NODE_20249_length_580_cov_0.600832_1_plen_71_part_00